MRGRVPVEARQLLLEAAISLEEECDAAGPDEVEEHPDLKAHSEVAKKIRRYLGKTKEAT